MFFFKWTKIEFGKHDKKHYEPAAKVCGHKCFKSAVQYMKHFIYITS